MHEYPVNMAGCAPVRREPSFAFVFRTEDPAEWQSLAWSLAGMRLMAKT